MEEITPKDIFRMLSDIPLKKIDAHSLSENAVDLVCGSHEGKEVLIGSTKGAKEFMKRRCDELKGSTEYKITEVGVSDYPTISDRIGRMISEDPFNRVGVAIGDTGNDVLVLGPKYPFVIGSRCISVEDARITRQHNNPNFLGLGFNIEPIPGYETIIEWLKTAFYSGDGKVERRLKRYLQELRIEIEAYEKACDVYKGEVDEKRLQGSLGKKEWILGSDHRGQEDLLKLIECLDNLYGSAWNHTVIEKPNPEETDKKMSDYPLISAMIGRKVSEKPLGRVGFGICGSGIGIGSAGMNFPGVYFSRCLSQKDANGARHTYSNFIGTGHDLVGFGMHRRMDPFRIAKGAMDKAHRRLHPTLPSGMYSKIRELEPQIYQFARQEYGL